MKAGPPAARASLGPAFWTLVSVAILAIVDAVQRGNFGFLARACIGAAFFAVFFLMAAAGDFDNLSLARLFRNVKHNHEEQTIHPYQFPEDLIARIVLATTDSGDIVLDPYMGTGTVALPAAISCGILAELSSMRATINPSISIFAFFVDGAERK